MKIYTTIKEASFTAKSKESGKVVNFASQQNRDNAIKSGEYEETDSTGEEPAAEKPKVNIFDKPKPQAKAASDGDGESKPSSMVAPAVVKTPVDVLKSKVEKWSEKEKAFFRDGIHKQDSPERRNWKDTIKDKAKGAIAAIKKGAKHEVEEFKTAGKGVQNFFSGKPLSEHEQKALKAVAIKVATTAIFGAVTGGAGHGVLAFGKHVAMEFIPHIVGETILKGVGSAALFAGDEEEDVYMERFMAIIADKMASEKITPELMTQMVDSYNAKKGEGDSVNEEIRELTPDQSEMVQGIIDMLLQIKDTDNRMEVAQQQIQNFKDEEIVFNYAWFLSAAGLDNNDEPVRMDVKTQPQHIINKESIMIGKINEDFKHIIHVDTPTQVVSKPVAAQIMALAKKGIRSKDIGLEMGFVGNAKLATDAFQKVKNKIYFELGNKNESVITEDTKRANILGIDFNISEMNGRIFFSFIDKKAASLKIREIGTNKIVNLIQKSLDNAYGKGEFFFKGGDHAEFQNGYLFQRNLTNVKLNKLKFESVNEVASRTAMEIGGLTGMNKDAIQKFVDEHNLDIEKVFQFVKKGKLPARMDFMTAVVGKPGNPIQKKIIKMFSESVNEGSHGMATKLLQSIVSGDSSRAEGTKMSKELAQHYIDWIRTSPFGKKYNNLPLDMLVKASFNWGIERGLDSKLKGELSKLKSTIKESIDEANKIEPKDDWGVRLVVAINNNVSSLHTSVMREKQDINKAADAFGTMLKNAIRETLKHKYKPHPKAKDADAKIKTFISELKKFEKIVDMVISKPTKVGITKLDDAWRSIWNHKYGAEIGLSGELFNSLIEGKFKKDDLVYNTRTKTVGIVRLGDDKSGEVKTDADGNVDVDELEKYNPIKHKHQQNAKVAPSTEKEVNSRGLFNPFKSESINEVKYPTNLYVGSVIYGQGFTGLKGIEGGKYYKVVEMDDTTATLAPCDQKGKITGSKKVRHKLSSIEGGIKTAKRGDENGIVIESVNEERILVRKVMGDDAEKFLKKYPKVKQTMSVIAKKNTDLMKGYKAFLKFKDAQEDYLGGRAEVSSSPTFGSKTFYKYDWGNLKNHWPEVYQYIYTLHFGGLDGATVEGINEAMGNDKSMLALVDILSNSMEYYEDDSDFLQAVRGGQGWSGIAGFKNSSLIPVFKSIYKKYWTVSPQNRTNWITKDWINWLKPFGLEENVNSETDTIEETTLNEKQFKGLEGIPANKSLEKISKAEKLNIIKAKGNMISFIVPDEYKGKRNFWQVISTGNIKKSTSGNIVMLMGGGPMNSPSFKNIDDLINGVDWASMERTRRFNESVTESTPGEQIQNLNNRLTKLRQDMAKAKSPEAKNVIQARMKNALQKLSDKKKDMGIKKP
jgi:hypothetical protein